MFQATPGRGLEFPHVLLKFDAAALMEGWTLESAICPLILDISPVDNPTLEHSTIFLDVVKSNETHTAKFMYQKYHANGQSYYEKEVYGLANASQEEPCIICMSNRKDTIVLPCRHL
jgi:hypothetical protein